ncbi:hypothetical protein [Lapidilactobacillus wuchangensis]|uniref:hypothetical protein n=1 Tax=Lapidilactobacillus wuchangensis TaxID=2486001 RepID=UPI0013DDCC99|nr:hypothetical protein [Lapidilactobacillus wuchangensis]
MEGSWGQPPNYCWCFSTYNKTCICDNSVCNWLRSTSAAFHAKQPAMESELILFQHHNHGLTVLNFSLQLVQIDAGRVPQPASPQ